MGSRTKMGDAAIEVMREYDLAFVGWGDAYALDEIRRRAGCTAKRNVPTDGWQHVLNALARDDRFEKMYFRGHSGTKGGAVQKRRLRYFQVKST